MTPFEKEIESLVDTILVDYKGDRDIDKLELHGSGGTDFNVAVGAFTGDAENQIIFTDGYADMPEQSCSAV